MSATPHRLGLLTALALLIAPLGLATVTPASAAPGTPGCASAFLPHATPASEVAASNPSAFDRAAARNGKRAAAFARTARQDKTLWLDRCGQSFYVEPATATTSSSAPSPATATVPLADTFTLESRPGSNRTIYLDFRGGTVTGTAWNSTYGSSIAVDPYSITAPGDTAFSDQELIEIQKAWQVVAEDYAPFDVNVTTRDPGSAAIDRSSSTDQVYGTRVMITSGGPIYTQCSCGGIAYVNVFNKAGNNHGYYQPAFVFTNGTGTNGKYFGEAAAHESGHNFGLSHDGASGTSYYEGGTPWAPIMGSSYSQPVTQWSRGEYAGANNTEDDLAIIATGAPLRSDDHGDTASTATPLAGGVTLDGLIGTGSDVDAFSFTASGQTTLNVAPAGGLPDLDVSLRIADASGATVATVDPVTSRTSYAVASGLAASWTATLPATPASYSAFVDGVGTGDPLTAGKYSDYGSLGNYQVSLATEATSPPAPLSATATDPSAATVGTSWSATPASASGGTGGYAWSASALPPGLALSASSGQVSGTPSQTGTWPVTFTVRDASGASASASATLTVQPAPVTPVSVASQSLSGARVGQPFSGQLAASGGDGAYAWSAGSGVPPGMALSGSGLLAGTPSTAGTWSFTATALSGGSSGSGAVTVAVAASASPLAITTTSLAAGKTGKSYAAMIATSGGTPAYSWKVGGTLPPGLALATGSSSSTTLWGTPTTKGKYTFSVTVTDATGSSAMRSYSLTVNK